MIEDIEYLKANCETESSVIYIDSSERNREFYADPEEYTITFDQPFKLVTGFDVLDASIPTTMWNVDKYNGTLAITVTSSPLTEINKEMSAYYFDELKDVRTFFRLFERAHIINSLNENTVVVVSKETYDTQPIEVSPIQTPYYAYIRDVMINTNIKVAAKNLDSDSYYTFEYRNIIYYVESSDADTIEILANSNFHVVINGDGLYDLVSFTEINMTEAAYTSINNASTYLVQVQNYYKQISLGNYDLTTLKTEINSLWNIVDVYVEATTLPDKKQGIFFFRSSGYVVVNARIGRLIGQLGFDTLPKARESVKYAMSYVGENRRLFAGLFDSTSLSYSITAPGIVNLLGNRFLILRMKEIEDHLLGSHGYMKNTPGIGLFKLASAYNDVTHLRFDFVNLVRKPFHPIGKLSKLSIKFETQKGELYDFKGVNHQLLLMVKYLVPTQKVNFNKYILNPNYDGNFMRYMSSNKTIEYKEDSDDEEEFTEKKYEEQYKKDFQKFDYSSSDSENVSESESSEVEFNFNTSRR